ncbi:unnamed protein product (macronuclear) [Paramecium tetraurelia]|uniref:Methyltransferase-like protein 5 n=1 Tax=Paramecium tetraurelia TaxID=5888 RepID=A0CJS9_PARTE|nr:uncharacterized protein GSPATT00000758001 [Paramecium tetraurelia]CAK71046.1 unnamed protein product [Paramecium tetraurelia]|eukprot:XP_001438443.1 hypothetical protein (macronuclear) [Paramecium tetraurelia strain d4-2]
MIKKKQLESFLQQVPDFDGKPNWNLEQHMTPPSFASEIIQLILNEESLENLVCADFGCGTGMLTAGLLCCNVAHVFAYEFDENVAQDTLQTLQEMHDGAFDLIITNIKHHKFPSQKVDLILMNPPFGTKEANIDTVFLLQAFQHANGNVYSIHKSSTRQYLEKLAIENKRTFKVLKEFEFPLPKKFSKYHKKDLAFTQVDFIKFGYVKQQEEKQDIQLN